LGSVGHALLLTPVFALCDQNPVLTAFAFWLRTIRTPSDIKWPSRCQRGRKDGALTGKTAQRAFNGDLARTGKLVDRTLAAIRRLEEGTLAYGSSSVGK